MWDRLRSATGGGGSAASPVDQYQGRTTPLGGRKDRASTLPPSSNSNNINYNSSGNSNSTANSAPSWQPRSSVIAARQGAQEPRPTKAGPPPPRPPREFELQPPFDPQRQQQQQQARSQTLPPPTSYHRNSIQGRPPSSVYSQTSPLVTDFGASATTGGGHAYRYATSPDNVSPPSSPEDTRAKGTLPNHDISPIDEEDDYSSTQAHPPARPLPEPPVKKMASSATAHASSSLPSQQRRDTDRASETPSPKTAGGAGGAAAAGNARSNIPMMRRERRAQRDAAVAAGRPTTPAAAAATNRPRGQKDPRWDPMTGEITSSDKGRPSQVKPVEFARGLGISTMSSTSTSAVISPGGGSPERARLPPRSGSRTGSRGGGPTTGSNSSSTDPAATAFGPSSVNQRPGWKGASGRTAIVDPVRDNPEVAPLKIPPRSRKREASTTTSTTTEEDQRQTSTSGIERVDDQDDNSNKDAMAGLGLKPSVPVSAETALAGENKGSETGVVIGGGGSAGPEMKTKKNKDKNDSKNPKSVSWATNEGPSSSEVTSTNTTSTPSTSASASISSTGRSLANTIRKIIPSSSNHNANSNANGHHPSRTSRFFSGSGGSSSRSSPTPTPTPDGSQLLTSPLSIATSKQPQHGYPSPPLSGNAIKEEDELEQQQEGEQEQEQEDGEGGSSLVNARHKTNSNNDDTTNLVNAATNSKATKLGNASHAKNRAKASSKANSEVPYSTSSPSALAPSSEPNHNHNYNHNYNHQPQPYSNPPHPYYTTSSSLSGQHQLQNQPSTASIRRKEVGTAAASSNSHPQHRPQESHSSSVYSHHDDYDQYHYQYQPQHVNSSKTLPNLPSGAANSVSDPSRYVQPPSRFSITTYATSAHTGNSSPRQSSDVAPPLPTPPKDIPVLGLNIFPTNNQSYPDTHPYTDADMAASSVLNRQRPQMRGGANTWEDPESSSNDPPVKISLSKAWMTTAGANSSGKSQQVSPPRNRQPRGPRDLASANKAADSSNNNKENRGMFGGFGFLGPKSPVGAAADSDSASVMSNMDKDLPPAPAPTFPSTANLPISERIAQLNAQLQDLANRRLNINRAIKQMTELMPQDNLIMPEAVRRKREDEKRKIEELKSKLDDIGREEHELGMKLHRAYKKLDQQTEYEPTTLWVRRATGN